MPKVSFSQLIKFGNLIFNRFSGVLCQTVHPESNINHFCNFSLFDRTLWFFIETRFWVKKSDFKIIVYCFPRVSYNHPQSNIRHSRSFSLFNSPPWFFLKTRLRLRKSNFKIFADPSLRFLAVIRPSYRNWFLANGVPRIKYRSFPQFFFLW